MPGEMLDFFKILLENKQNSKFLFITQDEPQAIISLAKSKDISSDKLIIISVNRNEVPLYLSLSDISIYFIKQLYSKIASSPTKTAEIMGMGIPIITNSGIGDSDEIISDSGAGMLIKNFTIKEYNRIIPEIDVLLNTDKAKIRAIAFKYFSLENGVDLYDEVYRKLMR